MRVTRFVILGLVAVPALLLTIPSCGSESRDNRRGDDDGVPNLEPPGFDESKPYVVKARWERTIGGGEAPGARFMLGNGSSNQAINATVAQAVTFTVDNSGFQAPADPTGVASFGDLSITALRDNSLRQCGVSGSARCTTALIRIYTTGTPGAGLWNSVESYGLPITTGAFTVGLGAANAATIGAVAIGTRNVVRLSDFTATGSLAVPIAVDFSDAASGSYSSTLVLEYLIQ